MTKMTIEEKIEALRLCKQKAAALVYYRNGDIVFGEYCEWLDEHFAKFENHCPFCDRYIVTTTLREDCADDCPIYNICERILPTYRAVDELCKIYDEFDTMLKWYIPDIE